jgi:hypothetical protein
VRVRLLKVSSLLNIYIEPRHILSNVGRVAARDSSRTVATANDLFVALCEDDSIYGFFKTMEGASVQMLI